LKRAGEVGKLERIKQPRPQQTLQVKTALKYQAEGSGGIETLA
jgi:hypothetical protein